MSCRPHSGMFMSRWHSCPSTTNVPTKTKKGGKISNWQYVTPIIAMDMFCRINAKLFDIQKHERENRYFDAKHLTFKIWISMYCKHSKRFLMVSLSTEIFTPNRRSISSAILAWQNQLCTWIIKKQSRNIHRNGRTNIEFKLLVILTSNSLLKARYALLWQVSSVS